MASSYIDIDRGSAGAHVSNVSGLAPSNQVWGAGSGHRGKSCKHLRQFRISSLNVNTLRGRVCEVVETLHRRNIDICCVQETRYRGRGCRTIKGKDSKFKLFWCGNNKGTAGVGVLVAEEWIDKVFDVLRVSERIILVKLIVGKKVVTILSVYAPQSGLSDEQKDLFYGELSSVTSKIPSSEILFTCGDWNGHVGSNGASFREAHGGFGYGRSEPDVEGERLLEYAISHELLIGNTCFKKRDSHLVTYRSGPSLTQIDFILYKKSFRRYIKDVKVIPGEEVALQHQLLVCDFLIVIPRQAKQRFVPRLRTWKLKDPVVRGQFQEEFTLCAAKYTSKSNTEDIWSGLKRSLLETTEKVCGKSIPHRWRQETWWWNETIDGLIKAKRLAFRTWQKGTGSRAAYDSAKRVARRAIHHARLEADKAVFEGIESNSTNRNVYRLIKQLRHENTDVAGVKPIRNDAGELSLNDEMKKKAWAEHFSRLLNIEFEWDPSHLPSVLQHHGSQISVTTDMIKLAISQMKEGKAAGPSGIILEMIKAAGDPGVEMIRDLVTSIIDGKRIPKDWEESFIVCLYKGKGDALDRGNYRGLKLTEHVLKILERLIDKLIRGHIHIDECQFGFVPGRGTTDAIFVIRQLQEKYMAAGKNIYMAFVDLEKAFDRIPRKVIWWAMRKLGIEEWIVQLVQGMYTNARSRVFVGNGYSSEFEVNVGVHQGSVLSPLLFIVVLEALSKDFRLGVPWEDLYADDLIIVAETLEECTRRLLIWKDEMEKKGLRVNAKKTKIMICGPGMDMLERSGKYPCAVCFSGVGNNSILCSGCHYWVHKRCSGLKRIKVDPNFLCKRCRGEARPVDGRVLQSVPAGSDVFEVVPSFCYLGDMLSAAGGSSLASITRIKSAWNKFNELLPVLSSKHLTLRTRGKIYNTCVRSVMLYGSEAWPMTKKDLLRIQRNDRAMIRRICNIRHDQIQTNPSSKLLFKLGLVDIMHATRERRLRWYGHVQRSRGVIRQVLDLSVNGRRRHGRPRKSWHNVVKDDISDWGLGSIDPTNRAAWRSSVKSAMRAASQSSGGKPTITEDVSRPAR